MKYLKYFNESEIYVGTNKHFNPLKAVNHQIFDEVKLYDFICEKCFNEFRNKIDLDKCPVCKSNDIKILP
jgi:predicted Zn-ribbon and HTH transcriptional regulator